ncbi:flagellar associated protein [Reticulomyxa filosa]|uniref:Flagellar associated protein n=1 Tax=Reticulomyxa filosa TaxID=46433 RepID=X6NKN6_RETFI|nr:flagellar associated protein [Reticulomyxa filosa]|eukprot:ETO26468.1 flagellar associated protein [Reticulomyxa filosa]
MATQNEKQVAQVKQRTASESERILAVLQKVENAFLKQVIAEKIEVSAFRSGHKISSFRTPALPEWLQQDIAKGVILKKKFTKTFLKKVHETDANSSAKSSDYINSVSNGNKNTGNEYKEKKSENVNNNPALDDSHINTNINDKQSASTFIKSPYVMLLEKPDENTDDPKDIEAIKKAKQNVGDYKLKSAEDYKVPIDKHIGASQKRKEMILLLEAANLMQMQLNQRVLSLRNLKKKIIESIQSDMKRLQEIDTELTIDIPEERLAPLLQEDPSPEHRYHYTKEEAKAFEKILEDEKKEINAGGDNAFGKDEESTYSLAKAGLLYFYCICLILTFALPISMSLVWLKVQPTSRKTSSSSIRRQSYLSAYQTRLLLVRSSSLEVREKYVKKRQLEVWSLLTKAFFQCTATISLFKDIKEKEGLIDRKVLLEKINSAVETFDNTVIELREEKYKVASSLKFTDTKLLKLWKEFNGKRTERKIIKIRDGKITSTSFKFFMFIDTTECQQKLARKLEEITACDEKVKKITQEFNSIVGERNPFYEQLKRVFTRKIKRKKRTENGDESSNSDETLESSNDVENDSASEEGDDSCPKDCDTTIFDKVIELREKKLDEEDALADLQKTADEVRTKHQALQHKEKIVDKILAKKKHTYTYIRYRNLQSAELEIQEFQTEKQKKLNKIIVTVPLSQSQIKIIQKESYQAPFETVPTDEHRFSHPILPANIDHVLVFELNGLEKLQKRVQEQEFEQTTLKKDYKELKKQHKMLTKRINEKQVTAKK